MPLRVSNAGGGSNLPNVMISGTSILPTLSSGTWKDVSYGNGRFVAIATKSNVCAYSTDGITWTSSKLPRTSNWQRIIYSSGRFIIISSSLQNAYYSTDGITWNVSPLSATSSFVDMSVGSGIIVMTSSSVDTTMLYSNSNGLDWRSSNMATSASWVKSIYTSIPVESSTNINNVFIALASNSNTINYSIDGVNWSAYTYVLGTDANPNWKSIACNKNIVVVIPSTGDSYRTTSIINRTTWTTRTLPVSTTWAGIYAFGSKFYLVPTKLNYILVSSDGITWDTLTMSTFSKVSMIEGGGIYLLLSSSNTSYWSIDGSSWTGGTKKIIKERKDSDPDKDYEFYGREVTVQDYTKIYDIDGTDYLDQLQRIVGKNL